MDLMYLYGPPAVGKLTVAQELVKRTGYKLFHNHLTVDLVSSLFEFPSEQSLRLSRRFRLEMFEEAAKTGVAGVIFTYVYEGGTSDDVFVKRVIEVLAPYKARIHFVQLTCSQEELFERVKHESRTKYQKISTTETLQKALTDRDLFSTIPYVDNLTIDNTNLDPQVVADKIISHYKLSAITKA